MAILTSVADPLHLEDTPVLPEEEGFSKILNDYGFTFSQVGYRLVVGNMIITQGWVLHLSAVLSRVTELMDTAIPILAHENVPFAVPYDMTAASQLLDGELGAAQMGKIICIYPETGARALSLARLLIPATANLQGPALLTDYSLGGTVHAWYGTYDHLPAKDFYGAAETTINDYTHPFVLPAGVGWPFSAICEPKSPRRPTILRQRYHSAVVLKTDIRGNVFKGVYLKRGFLLTKCLIKEGKKHMASDIHGRDMADRLAWQRYLHDTLSPIVPLPKILDHFKEGEDDYLVMEFIEGYSLMDKIMEINFNFTTWFQLSPAARTLLLGYLSTIVAIVARLHERGYVHRDLAPGNFLIDKHDKITLIDLELVYSMHDDQPNPPFRLGTPGFMSPQQYAALTPTFKEDIFGLGALILVVFTGLSPNKFDGADTSVLADQLDFFIQDRTIADLIASCLHPMPEARPELHTIQAVLAQYQNQASALENAPPLLGHHAALDPASLRELIEMAIASLSLPQIPILDQIWYSKMRKPDKTGVFGSMEFRRYAGLYEGLSGPLYLIAKAKTAGYIIHNSLPAFAASWQYIFDQYLQPQSTLPPGLYRGAAGIALALSHSIRARLLPDNPENRLRIKTCLQLPANDLTVASGIAGVGIALMQCQEHLDNTWMHSTLLQLQSVLIDTQEKDGSWRLIDSSGKPTKDKPIGFDNGTAGISWFLLVSGNNFTSPDAVQAARRALRYLTNIAGTPKILFNRKTYRQLISHNGESGEIRLGLLLTFIKAYEILQEEPYRKIAEAALQCYPPCPVNTNLSQCAGLAGLGELFLEAARVFANTEWTSRANWISNLLSQTQMRGPGKVSQWLVDDTNIPTADLMTGMSGIIHYLMRYDQPVIGYSMLT